MPMESAVAQVLVADEPPSLLDQLLANTKLAVACGVDVLVQAAAGDVACVVEVVQQFFLGAKRHDALPVGAIDTDVRLYRSLGVAANCRLHLIPAADQVASTCSIVTSGQMLTHGLRSVIRRAAQELETRQKTSLFAVHVLGILVGPCIVHSDHAANPRMKQIVQILSGPDSGEKLAN